MEGKRDVGSNVILVYQGNERRASKGMVEEVDEFIHIRKCVSLGRVERLGKEK